MRNSNGSRRHGKVFFNQFNQLLGLANLLGTVGATFNEFTDNDVDDDYDDIRARNCSCGKLSKLLLFLLNIFCRFKETEDI